MASCKSVRDHELAKFTDDSCVKVTQCPGDSWSVDIAKVTTPTITNVTTPTAGTEFSHALAVGTKRFKVQIRGKSKIQLTYTSGASGTNYITVWPGNVYEEDSLDLSGGATLYMQTTKTGETVEILEWS